MMRFCGIILAVLLAAVTSSTAAHATNNADAMKDRELFVVGNIVFVLLHEFGHLVIDDFDIPEL